MQHWCTTALFQDGNDLTDSAVYLTVEVCYCSSPEIVHLHLIYTEIFLELYFHFIKFLSVKFMSFRVFVFQMHYQHLIKIYMFFVSAPYAQAL